MTGPVRYLQSKCSIDLMTRVEAVKQNLSSKTKTGRSLSCLSITSTRLLGGDVMLMAVRFRVPGLEHEGLFLKD
jgi:hypothetical protein